MKVYPSSICTTAVLLLVTGCATVEKPIVQKVPDQAAAISATSQQRNEQREKFGSFRTLKRKVAIARFTNETQYGRSFLVDQSYDPIGSQAVDMLSSLLLKTDKFILLERADLDRINSELALADAPSLQNMADYLILGSVTEFGRATEGKAGFLSRTKKQVAHAKVHVRLVDVNTGEVIYSEEGYAEAFSEAGTVLGMGSQAGYDSTLNDKALEGAIANLSSNMIENLLERKWRSYFLGYENGLYIIAGGEEQGLRVGDRFQVLRKGKTVKNPQTQMNLTLPGTAVGMVRIVSLHGEDPLNQISIVELIEGELPVMSDAGSINDYYILETETTS